VVRKGTIGPRIVDDINEALEELWMKELTLESQHPTYLRSLLEKMQQKKKKKTTSEKTTRD
jgi:hypothetical protein